MMDRRDAERLEGALQRSLERIREGTELLDRWLDGRVEGGDGPPPSIAQILDRFAAGEDPVLLLQATGFTREEAELLDELSRFHVAGLRSGDPEAGAAVIEAAEHVIDDVQQIDAWLRSGRPQADWVITMLPFDFSERERLDALRRILSRLSGPPIAPEQWRANREAFVAACEDLGVRVEEVAQLRGWEAIRQVVETLSPKATAEADDGDLLRQLRAPLQRLVTEDLLGPGWRRHQLREAPESASPDLASPEETHAIEARRTIDALVEAAQLTPGELEVLELDRGGYGTAQDIAEVIGTTPAAVRRRRADAMRKLRKVAGPHQAE